MSPFDPGYESEVAKQFARDPKQPPKLDVQRKPVITAAMRRGELVKPSNVTVMHLGRESEEDRVKRERLKWGSL